MFKITITKKSPLYLHTKIRTSVNTCYEFFDYNKGSYKARFIPDGRIIALTFRETEITHSINSGTWTVITD